LLLLERFKEGFLRDHFPKYWIRPDLKEMSGILLNLNGLQDLLLGELSDV